MQCITLHDLLNRIHHNSIYTHVICEKTHKRHINCGLDSLLLWGKQHSQLGEDIRGKELYCVLLEKNIIWNRFFECSNVPFDAGSI